MANNAVSIDRISESLPHLAMLQNGVSKIDADILKSRALIHFNCGIRVVFEPRKHVRFYIILQKINGSFLELKHANHRVGHNLKNKPCHGRFSFPVGGIGFESYPVARVNGLQNERPRAGGGFAAGRGSSFLAAGTIPKVKWSGNGAWG